MPDCKEPLRACKLRSRPREPPQARRRQRNPTLNSIDTPQSDARPVARPKAAPLHGFWYAASLSEDLGAGRMRAQTLLNLPLVLCRDRRGEVAALKDLCPHRAMPLSFGCFDGERIACGYHGWEFGTDGRCRRIPALVEEAGIRTERIGVQRYPCQEQDGYIWVYIPEPHRAEDPLPPVPKLPVLSDSYTLFHTSVTLASGVDNAVLGLIDPAHGPYVHQNVYWRNGRSIREKHKVFEPLPLGFRMASHAPSGNSAVYRLLGAGGGPVSVWIDFVLPCFRTETIEGGRFWFLSRTMMTPISDEECRMDFCAAWNCFRWVPGLKPLFGMIARSFLGQDKRAIDRQAIGLRQNPSLMTVGDADVPAQWYAKLKSAYVASRHNGGCFEHPIKEPITLHWRT